MRRPVLALTSATALVVVAASVAVATDTGPQLLPAAQTMRLNAAVDREESFDVGAAGFSLGDRLVFAGFATAAGSGADRGRFQADCTVADTLAGGSYLCQFNLALASGLLTAQGMVSAVGPRSSAAVTGGTRRFQNARGQLQIVDTSPGHATVTISLLP